MCSRTRNPPANRFRIASDLVAIRSPQSEIRNDAQDRVRVTEILQHDVGSRGAQLLDAVAAGRDRDRSRPAERRARHVERRVANDDGVSGCERRPAARRDARDRFRHQAVAMRRIVAERAARKVAPEIEIFELDARALFVVAGEQCEIDIVARGTARRAARARRA